MVVCPFIFYLPSLFPSTIYKLNNNILELMHLKYIALSLDNNSDIAWYMLRNFKYFVNAFPINFKIILCITLFVHGSAHVISDYEDSIIKHIQSSNGGKISDNTLPLAVLSYMIKVIVKKLFGSLWCLVGNLLSCYRTTLLKSFLYVYIYVF